MQRAQEIIDRLKGVFLNVSDLKENRLESIIFLKEALVKAESIRTLGSLKSLELLYTEIGNMEQQICRLSQPQESYELFSKYLSAAQGVARYVVLEPNKSFDQISICVCADAEILAQQVEFYEKRLL